MDVTHPSGHVWMDSHTVCCMDVCMYGWMDGWMPGLQVFVRMMDGKLVGVCMYVCTHGWMDGWQTCRRVCGWMDAMGVGV
jgi:hypothetical protein